MIQYAWFVELKTKAGRENEGAIFLTSTRSLLDRETTTVAWFAGRIDA